MSGREFDDVTPEAMFRWETMNISLLPEDAAKPNSMVKANREERARIGKHLKALRRVLDAANKPKYDVEKMVAEEKKLEELKAANQVSE